MTADDSAVRAALALGLPGATPPGLARLCELAAHVVGGGAAEVAVALPDGTHRLASWSGQVAVPADATEVGVPLVDESGQRFGTLLVQSREIAPGAERCLATVAEAVASAIALEAARAENFDLAEQSAVALETLSEAAGQLVHDVNNPLAAASMALEIARDEVEEGLVAQLLDRAVNSTTRMKAMVTDLLAFSSRPVRGSASLAEALDGLRDELAGLPVSSFVVGDVDVEVPLSAGDLELVLVALLDNAVKFAADGSEPQVEIVAVADSAGTIVEIRDGGRGVEPADRERVFAPTLRLDRKVPGMGLGLPTVRRIVGAGGGAVHLEDSPLGGVTVRIEWPAAGPASSSL